jgi:hypothetical protein
VDGLRRKSLATYSDVLSYSTTEKREEGLEHRAKESRR